MTSFALFSSDTDSAGRHHATMTIDRPTSGGHTVSTIALCACSLINAYLAISVFPYAGYMVMEVMEGVDRDNVGTYAGLIASSFMGGRTLSAFHWGKVADMYGRTFVLQSCLVLSAVFSCLLRTDERSNLKKWASLKVPLSQNAAPLHLDALYLTRCNPYTHGHIIYRRK